MDAGGWFILLLFIGIIGYAVYYSTKTGTEDAETTYGEEAFTPPYTTSPTPKPVIKPTPRPVSKPTLKTLPEIQTKKSEPVYVSIYEYTAKNHVKCCAYCDGENDFPRTTCRICGNELDT